jgi:hypothetical protein
VVLTPCERHLWPLGDPQPEGEVKKDEGALLLLATLVVALAAAGTAYGSSGNRSAHHGSPLAIGTPPVLDPLVLGSSSPGVICGTGCNGGGSETCYSHPHYPPNRSYAGYEWQGLPAPGAWIVSYIRMNYDLLTITGNFTAAWVGVTNSTGSTWVQTGITDGGFGNGLRLYIELGGQPAYDLGPASYNTNYLAGVANLGNGIWRAQINGMSMDFNAGTMAVSQFTSESYDQNATNCNQVIADFTGSTPSKSGMSFDMSTPNDYVTPISGGWESVQP